MSKNRPLTFENFKDSENFRPDTFRKCIRSPFLTEHGLV